MKTTNRPKYLIQIFWSDETAGYIAIAPDLPGCNAFGDTPVEAIQEMQDAMESWMEAWVSLNRPLPEPKAAPQKAA